MPEIQFRKYADPAAEQLNDCGTMRWRTANRFAAPMVVRMPGGFFKCGDPWHSWTNEVPVRIGWRGDAVQRGGRCRSAAPPRCAATIRRFSSSIARCSTAPGRVGPIPAMNIVPFGKARLLRAGTNWTIVTWGAMVERCEHAAADSAVDVELTRSAHAHALGPRGRAGVGAQDERCLIVHEDNLTAGFGAEIAATRARCILRPGCADRARHDARRTEPAQSAAARCGSAERRAHRPGNSHHRQHLRTKSMTASIEIRAPSEQTEGTRSQVQRWLKSTATRRRERAADRARDRQGHDRDPGAGRWRARGDPQAGAGRQPGELLGRIEAGAEAQGEAVPVKEAVQRASDRRCDDCGADGTCGSAIRRSQQSGRVDACCRNTSCTRPIFAAAARVDVSQSMMCSST